MAMKQKLLSFLNWHTIAQAAATFVQVANFTSGIVPEKYQPVVLIAVSFAQWTMGTIAHYQQPPK
jgi:hypothetical protein